MPCSLFLNPIGACKGAGAGARETRNAVTVPRVKEAIAEGACAATVDEWTENTTKQVYLSFVVHTANKSGALETDYLVTIPFDEEASGMLFLKSVIFLTALCPPSPALSMSVWCLCLTL